VTSTDCVAATDTADQCRMKWKVLSGAFEGSLCYFLNCSTFGNRESHFYQGGTLRVYADTRNSLNGMTTACACASLVKYAPSPKGLRGRRTPAPCCIWKEVLVAQCGQMSRHCLEGLEENHENLKLACVQADIQFGRLQNTSQKPKKRTKRKE
jgi:hypothetical protein